MIRPLRTLASAKLAWFLAASTLAPGAVATTHARTVKDRATGAPVTIQVTRAPRYVVRAGSLSMGTLLLKLWLRHAQRVQASPQLMSELEVNEAGVPVLPPLYTSGRELAQKLRCTDRSTRTYLAELKAINLVTKYQFRGREHAYCVWINPDFVWEIPVVLVTDSELSPSAPEVVNPNGKNFPLKELLETLETQKSGISEVEKLVPRATPAGATETGNPLTGNAGSPSGCSTGVQTSKSGAGAAGAARRERFYQKAAERGQGPLVLETKRYVEAFWSYAKALIYKGKTFTPEEERLAKIAIWRGVFHNFSTGTPADWAVWMKPLERRLELASAWLQRNPAYRAPMPYAEVIAGRGYFDAGNTQGFAATDRWQRDEQRLHQQGALERAVDEALTELHQRRRLDQGQRRVQASKRAKLMDYNRLHKYHWDKLRRMGGEDALHRFAARLQAEHLLYHAA